MTEILKGLHIAIREGDENFEYGGIFYDVTKVEERMELGANIALFERLSDGEMDYLAELMMFEYVFNTHPDKTTLDEYPIKTKAQLARRQSGAHRKKDYRGTREVSFVSGNQYGTDGFEYCFPNRRKREPWEHSYMDENYISRNKERRKKYNEFKSGKSPGVFTVNILTGEVTGKASAFYK